MCWPRSTFIQLGWRENVFLWLMLVGSSWFPLALMPEKSSIRPWINSGKVRLTPLQKEIKQQACFCLLSKVTWERNEGNVVKTKSIFHRFSQPGLRVKREKREEQKNMMIYTTFSIIECSGHLLSHMFIHDKKERYPLVINELWFHSLQAVGRITRFKALIAVF